MFGAGEYGVAYAIHYGGAVAVRPDWGGGYVYAPFFHLGFDVGVLPGPFDQGGVFASRQRFDGAYPGGGGC